MQRRRFISYGAVAVWLPCRAAADASGEAYARDIDFLLAEFEKQAGHFFEAKKINWPAVTREFREAIKGVATDTAYLKLCQRLTAKLKDGHAGITQSKITLPDESAGRRWTGPRVHLLTIGDDVFVRLAFKDAEAAGLKSGQQVSAINGLPARQWLDQKMAKLRESEGYSTDHQALYAACHLGPGRLGGHPHILFHPNRRRHRNIHPPHPEWRPQLRPCRPHFSSGRTKIPGAPELRTDKKRTRLHPPAGCARGFGKTARHHARGDWSGPWADSRPACQWRRWL